MGLSIRDPPVYVAAIGLVLSALILVVGWRSRHDEVSLVLATLFLIFGVFGSMRLMGSTSTTSR